MNLLEGKEVQKSIYMIMIISINLFFLGLFYLLHWFSFAPPRRIS